MLGIPLLRKVTSVIFLERVVVDVTFHKDVPSQHKEKMTAMIRMRGSRFLFFNLYLLHRIKDKCMIIEGIMTTSTK